MVEASVSISMKRRAVDSPWCLRSCQGIISLGADSVAAVRPCKPMVAYAHCGTAMIPVCVEWSVSISPLIHCSLSVRPVGIPNIFYCLAGTSIVTVVGAGKALTALSVKAKGATVRIMDD